MKYAEGFIRARKPFTDASVVGVKTGGAPVLRDPCDGIKKRGGEGPAPSRHIPIVQGVGDVAPARYPFDCRGGWEGAPTLETDNGYAPVAKGWGSGPARGGSTIQWPTFGGTNYGPTWG